MARLVPGLQGVPEGAFGPGVRDLAQQLSKEAAHGRAVEGQGVRRTKAPWLGGMDYGPGGSSCERPGETLEGRLTIRANSPKRNAPPVSGLSPGGAKSDGTSIGAKRLGGLPALDIALRPAPQPTASPMSGPRLRDPFPKSRCVRRELYPKGASYRPNASRRLRDNCGQAIAPDLTFTSGGPKHDPLSVSRQRKAGEASGPRHGQGSYTELKSVASTPHPSLAGEGRHSGTRTYGEMR